MQAMLCLTAAILAGISCQVTATSYGYGDDDFSPLPPRPPFISRPHPQFPPPVPTPLPPSGSCGAADSFEGPDPLAQWTLDINDDAGIPPIAVFCTGDLGGEPADYSYGGVVIAGRTNTFTDAVDEAADGECALRVRAGCLEGPAAASYRDYVPATNSASRTFTVANAGCGAAAATGFTLAVAVTFDVKDPYATEEFYGGPYDGQPFTYLYDGEDRAAVTATVRGAEISVAEVTSASAIRQLMPFTVPVEERDYGIAEEFLVFTADLGDVAPGESIEVTVTVSSTNDQFCVLNFLTESSVIVIDDIRIEPRF